MTNQFTCYSVTEVPKTTGVNYKVTYEDRTIFIPSQDVEKISLNSHSEEKEIIAVILATIKMIYRDTCVFNKKLWGIDRETLIRQTREMLSEYPAEKLIENIRQLKWYQIVEIYSQSDSVKKMQEII